MKRSSDSFIFTAELGQRLRDLRLKAGLTQLELARVMGRAGKKAGNLVGRLERGEERYPSFSMYEAKVKNAVEDMVSKRLMLREDAGPAVDRLIKAGQATGAIRMDASSK